MRVPATVRWIGLALLGILIAAGISIAASGLASQQIGLASEPLTAGDALAPSERGDRATRHSAPSAREHRPKGTKPSATPPPPATAPPTTPPPATTPAPAASPPAPGEETGQGGDGGGGGDD